MDYNKIGDNMARPSIYEQWKTNNELDDKLLLVSAWARDGLSQEQIADNLGIAAFTLIEYKKRYPDFYDALKKGKEVVDIEVENALLKKAREGDLGAIIFWLKNRKPDTWRDKQTVAVTNGIENIKPIADMYKMEGE